VKVKAGVGVLVLVAVEVWVDVEVKVFVTGTDVWVRVKVGVLVLVLVAVAVRVFVGVFVLVGVEVETLVKVRVAVGVTGWGMIWIAETLGRSAAPVENWIVMVPPLGLILLKTLSSAAFSPTSAKMSKLVKTWVPLMETLNWRCPAMVIPV
jgi:hypothetical protein